MQDPIQSATSTNTVSKKKLWTGRIMSAISVLFLLFDSIIHMLKPQFVIDSFNQLGYSPDVSVPLGIIMLICVVLYVFPRTSILGAILLTGYLGGAVATNVRVGAPLFSTILFPVYVGILIWGGLYLRDQSVSSIFPWKKRM